MFDMSCPWRFYLSILDSLRTDDDSSIKIFLNWVFTKSEDIDDDQADVKKEPDGPVLHWKHIISNESG